MSGISLLLTTVLISITSSIISLEWQTYLFSVVLFPDTICKTLNVKSLQVLIRIKAILIVVKLVVIAIPALSLLVIVIHVIHWVKLFDRILLIVLLHNF